MWYSTRTHSCVGYVLNNSFKGGIMTQEVQHLTLSELVDAVMKKIRHWLREHFEFIHALNCTQCKKKIRFAVGNKGAKPLTDVQRKEVVLFVESLCKKFGLTPTKTRDDITVAWHLTVPA